MSRFGLTGSVRPRIIREAFPFGFGASDTGSGDSRASDGRKHLFCQTVKLPRQLASEKRRLEILRQYGILDTENEEAFDEIAALTARLCDAPIALIALVDRNRVWFKGGVGVSVAEIPREISFCGHAIGQKEVFVINDAAADERFADNPLVAGEPRVRFYSAVPLVSPEGFPIGTLHVADVKARELSERQAQALRVLGRDVMAHLNLRRLSMDRDRAGSAAPERDSSLREDFYTLVEAVPHIIWGADPDGGVNFFNQQCLDYIDRSYEEMKGWGWQEVIKPGDLPATLERWSRSLETGELYESEFRILRARDGAYRWHLTRALPVYDSQGRILQWYGTCTDIHDRKEAGEKLEKNVRERTAELAVANERLRGMLAEHERIERSLRESESRFRQLSENIREVFWLAEPDKSHVLYVSPAYEEIWGRRCGDLYADPGQWVESIHPQDRERVVRAAKQVSETFEYDEEYRIVQPDGSIRWIRDRAFPVRDENGMVYRVAGVADDITRRHLAEVDYLRETTRREAILNALPAHIALLDVEGNILTVNESWKRFGEENNLPGDECGVGCNYLEVCEGARGGGFEEAAASAEGIRRVLAGKQQEFILEYPCHSPEENRWFRMMATPLRKGAQGGAVVMHIDVTERRLAEEQYRSLVDGARDIIFTLSPTGELASLNPAFESVGGWSREEWLGKDFSSLIHPDDASRAGKLLSRVVGGENLPVFELRAVSSEGVEVPMEFTVNPQWLGSQIVGILGVARDIRERKHLEEQVRQSQKMESIGRLAAGIAHDYNNLLTIQKGYLSLLSELPELDPEVRRPIREVAEAAERASQLTRQLLLFSRKEQLQTQTIDLGAVVDGMSQMLGRILGEDVLLEVKCSEGLPPVSADPGMMEQVIMNLAVNARDAMPNGGRLLIEVEASDTSPGEEEPSGMRSGTFVLLTVEDTGTGISRENMDRIFEPFFTTKLVGQGVGLGLATVYGIVKQHRGEIDVESRPGAGTCFHIYLPAAREPIDERPAERLPESLGGNEPVLVVEDESAVRKMVESALSRQGYAVLSAASGPEALEIWEDRGRSVNLLMTDLVMPGGMTGRELAARLTECRGELKVLFTSGYDPEVTGEQAIPARSFLQKPYTLRELARRVRSCLDEADRSGR